MVLELHVWGPAFGLPSIEPECIATIAYCQRVIPKGEWSLVAEHNPTVGTTGTACPPYRDCIGRLHVHRELADTL
jgi:hypothetical protein